MAKKVKSQAKLVGRRLAFDDLKEKQGYKRPGSMNTKKQA